MSQAQIAYLFLVSVIANMLLGVWLYILDARVTKLEKGKQGESRQ